MPEAGYSQFVAWAGGTAARVMIVTWSTEEYEASYSYHRQRINLYSPGSIFPSPHRDVIYEREAEFLEHLASSTGVFFTGGDQNYLLDIVDKRPAIRDALRAAYDRGIVFGGTSAGTAIMSAMALTGDESEADGRYQVGVRNGLGMLHGLIVDQHFVQRNRFRRLTTALKQTGYELGIGVDEGAVFVVEDNRIGRVEGNYPVIAIDGVTQKTTELLAGDRFDLIAKRIID